MYINGEFVDSNEFDLREVHDPATGAVVGSYRLGTIATAKDAIDVATRAFAEWPARTGRDRSDYLSRIARSIEDHQAEIAETVTRENGKPLVESIGEVRGAIAHFDWYAEEAPRIYGRIVPPTDPSKRHFVTRKPVGVVACIAPWNFPIMLWARKVAPALAAGCTVVARSASQTTLSTLAMIRAIDKVGLPPGVINQVTGPAGVISDELMSNSQVRKLTFTGSTEVGRTLLAKSAEHITNLSLELGGQAPGIVFDDADLDLAVAKVFGAKFRNGGRSCIAINRIYVQSGIYDKFTKAFIEKVRAMKVGNGFEEDVELGPLIDEESVAKYESHVADVTARGGRIAFGGERLMKGDFAKGFFVEPCVALDVDDNAYCMCDETFGPLAPIVRFDSAEEAIRRANDSPYGLSAYVYTQSLNTAFTVGEALDAGTVAVNDHVPSTTIAPFGGFKQSGLGRECGIEGIEAFLETKHISVRL